MSYLSLLSKISAKIGGLFIRLSHKLCPPLEDTQALRVKPWFADNGDKTLRLYYDLDEDSTVFDLGGFEGQWASDIYSMYSCTIHIFEPVNEYAQNIKRRFAKNKKVHVHQYGLAGYSRDERISL